MNRVAGLVSDSVITSVIFIVNLSVIVIDVSIVIVSTVVFTSAIVSFYFPG